MRWCGLMVAGALQANQFVPDNAEAWANVMTLRLAIKADICHVLKQTCQKTVSTQSPPKIKVTVWTRHVENWIP